LVGCFETLQYLPGGNPRATVSAEVQERSYRKPELVEIAVGAVSLSVFCWVIGYFSLFVNRALFAYPNFAAFILLLLAVVVLAETISARSFLRLVLLVAQCLLVVVLLSVLGGRFELIEIALVLTLLVQVTLRLPLVSGTLIGIAILGVQFYLDLVHGNPLQDQFLALLPGVIVLFLSQAAVSYRERLVRVLAEVEFQRHSLENLTSANQSFVEHLEDVEIDSAERERMRITRELHDSIGYSMTNIVMMMNAARYLVESNPEKLVEYCQNTKSLAAHTLRDTREILYKLRGVEKHRMNNARIFFVRLCGDFTRATGVATECHPGNLPGTMGDLVFSILFRALQVGLINALRHSQAGRIRVSFWKSATELRMTIWNSVADLSAHTETFQEGIGFRGMRERLASVNGRLDYGRVIDGFELTLTIPEEELPVESDKSSHS